MAGEAWLAKAVAGPGAFSPRVLILAAHPDDETIGLGGTMPRFADLHLLHVTDGAPRDGADARAHGLGIAEYGAVRRREVEAALALAGVDPRRARCLGIPDQEVTVRLPEVIGAVARVLRELRPALLVTHPYEGGHPDHDATALAAAAACRVLGEDAPELAEMTSYHAAPEGIAVGRFLPAVGAEPVALPLDLAARARKRRMLDAFATQRRTLAQFPVQEVEWLRPAPAYDFRRPPHPGRLFYEGFGWGMTGERFRALAREALAKVPA